MAWRGKKCREARHRVDKNGSKQFGGAAKLHAAACTAASAHSSCAPMMTNQMWWSLDKTCVVAIQKSQEACKLQQESKESSCKLQFLDKQRLSSIKPSLGCKLQQAARSNNSSCNSWTSKDRTCVVAIQKSQLACKLQQAAGKQRFFLQFLDKQCLSSIKSSLRHEPLLSLLHE